METNTGDWFGGKSVFVTGSTGFVGKVLVEKLLRSCQGLERVYVLCRPKRGSSANARICEMTRSTIFDRLREENPQALRKLRAVQGDLTLQDLGIHSDLREELIRRVQVVFHLGASNDNGAQIKTAVGTNTAGTLRVLELANSMSKLEAFVHVSSAYCHSQTGILDEQLYPSKINARDIIKTVHWMDNDTLNIIAPKITRDHPNCHLYSKHLAESVISEFSRLPVAVVRTMLVFPALKEPMPGWMDKLYGPILLPVAIGKGLIRSIFFPRDHTLELTPVDMLVNTIISIPRTLKQTRRNNNGVPVYNVTSGDILPLTWGKFFKKSCSFGYEYPFENILWYPNCSITANPFVHALIVFLLQTVPAYLIDLVMLVMRNKRFMVQVQNKVRKSLNSLECYTRRDWAMKTNNVRELSAKMNVRDQETFYINNLHIDPDEYLTNSFLGIKRYHLKESLNSVSKTRNNLRLFFILDFSVKIILGLVGFAIFIWWINMVHSLLDFCVYQVEDMLHLSGIKNEL